jgi:hypothetical protein
VRVAVAVIVAVGVAVGTGLGVQVAVELAVGKGVLVSVEEGLGTGIRVEGRAVESWMAGPVVGNAVQETPASRKTSARRILVSLVVARLALRNKARPLLGAAGFGGSSVNPRLSRVNLCMIHYNYGCFSGKWEWVRCRV